MNIIGIIPSRMDSKRFPGKPMQPILGIPMVAHCYLRAKMVSDFSFVYVATCDNVIINQINGIGGRSIMTSSEHSRATSRTSEALLKIEQEIGEKVDIVVMIQGDEPLFMPRIISEVINEFNDSNINIVNVMSKINSDEKFLDKNNVKVVFDLNFNAIYFSREPIPSSWNDHQLNNRYMQTGLIAFRRDALLHFNQLNETPLEQCESVDMNRLIENAHKIRMLPIEDTTIGVDTLEDLIDAEDQMRVDPIFKLYFNSINVDIR